jgi:hypothetical protein
MHRGFLVYTLSALEYRKRVVDGQHIYVFEIDGVAVGFICGYGEAAVQTYLDDHTLSHESDVCHAIQTAARTRGDARYSFLDQIAIKPQFQERGLGEEFFHLFCQVVPGPYYVVMLEQPIFNPRIHYWCARGFTRIGHVIELLPNRFAPAHGAAAVSGELTWGIYVLATRGFVSLRARA